MWNSGARIRNPVSSPPSLLLLGVSGCQHGTTGMQERVNNVSERYGTVTHTLTANVTVSGPDSK